MLSLLATHSWTGPVKGLSEFAPADQPPLLPLMFYGFRAMAGIGFWMFFLMLWSVVEWARGRLDPRHAPARRWLWRAWMATIPLGYVAVDLGWTIREVGRQPWVIYGLMRTREGASALPVASVSYTLLGYLIAYAILLITFVLFAWRIVRQGPDLAIPPPGAPPHDREREGQRAAAREA